MPRWEQLFKHVQQDLKLFLFILGVICLFRSVFIGILHEYLSETTTGKDILMSLYYGTRLSLKSAGIITLFSFISCTLASLIIKSPKLENIRFGLGCFYITVLSILFQVRIPYYEQFHTAFSIFIFNILKDDTIALFYTLIQQYHLIARVAAALVVAGFLCWCLKLVLNTRTYRMPKLSTQHQRYAFRIGLVLSMALFIIFTRFGGSLTYGSGISWESAAKSKDEFLNEAILDDFQALYRAYSINAKMKSGKDLNITTEQIHEYGNYLAGHTLQTTNIEEFLKKEAQGAKIKKPRHIFLILGESYAEWPLLPQYKDLNLANGLKGIIAQRNAVYVPAFLPASISTMPAVNSIVTGFPEINLSPNYQAESYKAPYATSFAVQMKKLGYKTYFWYGGFSSWQRLEDFTLAQGFDRFLGCSDLQNQDGNAWGSEDKYFLTAISNMIQDEEPTFHVILTTSNHPPYTVNLQNENFDGELINSGLPDKLKSDQEWIKKLGHFWYADKVLADFVQNVYKKYPDSLFIITGDHGDRVNLETNPALYERYAVPLVIYGQGVTKELLPNKTTGSHIDIMPTLIELVAPAGFNYYSVGESLTTTKGFGTNDQLWITPEKIGRISGGTAEALSSGQTSADLPAMEKIKQDLTAKRGIAWWRITRGKSIE
ncbi:LTA synthase family protein [Anaerospora hongkongensis]|uniref:LTA synthase family protein n=1 Tax=Anaerospora hongkongensis TaxID=244830 RepID=UPI00289E3461|nr:sulfatase-like hydrolase/transferase [Anaerospora hongkongensis]